MVRKTPACLFTAFDCRVSLKQAAAVVLVALVFFPTLFSHVVLWRLEHKLNCKIGRKPLVFLMPGYLKLDPASVNWKQGKLNIISGTLFVRYPIYAWLWPRFTFTLDGKQLTVQLGSELAKAVGREKIIFTRVQGKFLVRGNQQWDIVYLDAESDSIEFHLKERGCGSSN